MNHSGPTDLYKEVASLSNSTPTGPEDESLQFADTYDELRQHRPKRSKVQSERGRGLRFGDILTTLEVGTALMSYRAHHDTGGRPSVRFGTMLYETSLRAVANGGVLEVRGGTLNRYL